MSQSIIELKNVNIYQGETIVLSDVNISIDKSEFVYLVGKT
jgi:cell division transport system ATP-binding protein